jgi:hypothetical protein
LRTNPPGIRARARCGTGFESKVDEGGERAPVIECRRRLKVDPWRRVGYQAEFLADWAERKSLIKPLLVAHGNVCGPCGIPARERRPRAGGPALEVVAALPSLVRRRS